MALRPFTPETARRLRVFSDSGLYHHEAEWSVGIPHPIEVTRGQTASGDAFSPGWFELPLAEGEVVTLVEYFYSQRVVTVRKGGSVLD